MGVVEGSTPSVEGRWTETTDRCLDLKNCGDAEASGSLSCQSTGMSQTDALPRRCRLADAAATTSLGLRLATLLAPGDRLLLYGDLGVGKTTLVQGLAEGLGIDEAITSPSFALAQHYPGAGGRPGLVHLDLYRLEDARSADELFAQEQEEADALGAVLALEWPERLSQAPLGAWRLRLEYAEPGDPDAGRLAQLAPPETQQQRA
jgi:tRNA threonylcarbamoyladenosine biosynthesis protein TsaE